MGMMAVPRARCATTVLPSPTNEQASGHERRRSFSSLARCRRDVWRPVSERPQAPITFSAEPRCQAEVGDQAHLCGLALGASPGTQDSRWVDRHEHVGRKVTPDRAAPIAGHANRCAKQRLRGGGAHQHENGWLDELELGLDPGKTCAHLGAVGALVQASLVRTGAT